MSLQVWLPLNGDMHSQGLINLTPTQLGTINWVDGKIGKSLSAGTSTQTANGISYNSNLVNELGNEFSAAIWVKPLGNHVHYNGTFISSGDWNQKRWAFGVNQNNTQVDVFCQGHNTYLDCNVPVNTWTHLVCVHQGTTVKLYKNGEYVGEKTGVPEFLDSDASDFCVGRETYANGYFSFNGNLNDIRIYDHALSVKEIKEISKGLVLHYKLDGKYETSSNLITTDDGLSNTAYNGATGKYGYNTDSNIAKVVGDFNGKHCTKVYMITAGQNARPYVYINNLFVSNGGSQPEYKTISFDYYGTIGTYINHYKLGNGTGTAAWKNITTGQSGNFTNSGNILVTSNKWNHIEIILHGTTEADAQFGYFPLGDTHVSSTDNYWLFANVQVEAKDHVTPYMGPGGDRNYTTEFDCSGYNNNGIRNNNPQFVQNNIRYKNSTSLNGTNQTIEIGNLSTIVPSGIFTFNIWFYKTELSGKGYDTIFGGPSGFEVETRNAAETNPVVVPWNWGKSSITYEFNKWNMLTMIKTSSETQWYLNGELWATGSVGSIPSGNYFLGSWRDTNSQNYKGLLSDARIYATALSAEDVLELYHTSASIDNKGSIYAYELEEV